MSAPPDFITQLLQGNNPYGTNGALYSPAMGIAAKLLEMGGPQRMPVSLGQALGASLQQGQQFQTAGLQNAMQQLMLGKTGAQMQILQSALNPTQDTQQPAQQAQTVPAAQSATNGLNSPAMTMGTSGSVVASALGGNKPVPQVEPHAIQAAPTLPRIDPYQDPVYVHNQKLAQVMDMMQPGSGAGYAAAAQQRLQDLNNQEMTLTDEQARTVIPGGTVPGQVIQYNPYTGTIKTAGTEAIKPSQGYDQYGNLISPLTDVRTGKTVGPASSAIRRTPGTPLPGPLESQAQGLANYTQSLDGINKRGMTGLLVKQRAAEINPAWDETTYPSKQAAMKSLASGKDYQTNSAYSTIQTHLQTLNQAFDALNNGDMQSANKLTQWSGRQLGKSAPQNAKVVNDIVVGELAKVLAQGGTVTDSVRAEAAGDLEPYLSKGQYQGATQYIQQLIAGKMETSKINALANHIPEDVFMAHLSPEARQALQEFEATHPNGAQAAGGKTLTYDPATGTFK